MRLQLTLACRAHLADPAYRSHSNNPETPTGHHRALSGRGSPRCCHLFNISLWWDVACDAITAQTGDNAIGKRPPTVTARDGMQFDKVAWPKTEITGYTANPVQKW